jgi:hypothetical protein
VVEGTAYEVVEEAGEPVQAPPTHTPEPEQSGNTPTPEQPTKEPDQPDQPTAAATPASSGETTTSRPSSGLCAGAMVMGVVTLAAAMWWQRALG